MCFFQCSIATKMLHNNHKISVAYNNRQLFFAHKSIGWLMSLLPHSRVYSMTGSYSRTVPVGKTQLSSMCFPILQEASPGYSYCRGKCQVAEKKRHKAPWGLGSGMAHGHLCHPVLARTSHNADQTQGGEGRVHLSLEIAARAILPRV